MPITCAGAAQREKSLTQDMETLLEDSEAAEARCVIYRNSDGAENSE